MIGKGLQHIKQGKMKNDCCNKFDLMKNATPANSFLQNVKQCKQL